MTLHKDSCKYFVVKFCSSSKELSNLHETFSEAKGTQEKLYGGPQKDGCWVDGEYKRYFAFGSPIQITVERCLGENWRFNIVSHSAVLGSCKRTKKKLQSDDYNISFSLFSNKIDVTDS